MVDLAGRNDAAALEVVAVAGRELSLHIDTIVRILRLTRPPVALGGRLMLRGALGADGMVGLKMNVPRANLKAVIQILPAMKNPTVAPLADEGWVALETILSEPTVRDLIPKLKRAGAEGLVEYPLNKVIP